MQHDDEPFRRPSCGKIPYLSRKDARRDSHRRVVPAAGRMRAYRCENCPYWHVGHLPWLVRKGELTATQFYRLAKGGELPAPRQRPVDMSEGILLPTEVASIFRVTVKTTYEWARAYQADNPDVDHDQLAAFLTPGGQWRFSAKEAFARASKEDSHG